MTWPRRVLQEIHRRALWQVLAIFVVAAWAVLRLVEHLTRIVGLPEWTWDLALVLLLVGLPIVVITAFVQRGAAAVASSHPAEASPGHDAPGGRGLPPGSHGPARHHRLFTWRNALLGALGAGTLLLTSVSAYLVMWATGVGPMGSLIAQGVLDAGDPVMVAELEDRAGDPTLVAAVTDALGVDFLESAVVTPVDGSVAREMLHRMGRPGGTPVTSGVAREAAVREGIKAVVEGELSRMGEGYVIEVRFVAPADGRSIAAFRETARTPADLLGAVDRVSQRLREKAGEPLRDIRAEEPLEAVTTSSLDALRRFADADRAADEGDVALAVDLLGQAAMLDTAFAMAYRRLAALQSRPGGDDEARIDAVTRAYRHRDRLSERERHFAEAQYHRSVTGNDDEVARAYRRVLDAHPRDPEALSQLALIHLRRSEWRFASELLERAVIGPGRTGATFGNLVISLYNEGRKAEAVDVLDRWAAAYPTDPDVLGHRATVAWGVGEPETARRVLEEGIARFRDDARAQVDLRRRLGHLSQAQGRLGEARGHLTSARAVAEAEGMPGLALEISLDLARVGVLESADTLGEMRRLERYAGGLGNRGLRERLDLFLGDAWARVGRRPDRAEAAWGRDEAAPRAGAAGGTDEQEAEIYRRSVLDNLRGRHAEALDGFRDLDRRTGCDDCYLLETAEAFVGVGEPDSALVRLETWVKRDLFHLVDQKERCLGDVLPTLAGLYERVGRLDDAEASWLRLAARWAHADASLTPRVRRARGEVERLTRQGEG